MLDLLSRIDKVKLAYRFMTIGLVLGVMGIFMFSYQQTFNLRQPIQSELFDHLGSFIGGITGSLFSLASILLLIHTIQEQQKQQIAQEKLEVESRFFELLKFHREHVVQMQAAVKSEEPVFKILIREFKECLADMTEVFPELNTADKDDTTKLFNIAYLLFFFGNTEDGSKADLLVIFSEIYPDSNILNRIAEKRKGWQSTGGIVVIGLPFYYHGRRDLLGLYFRHLIQIVRYVNRQTIINYREKYDLIKILRAQMSDEEQALLFYNSISTIGAPWEIGQKAVNDRLITKYNLIKNIPHGLYFSIDPRLYYPQVDYHNMKSRKRDLDKKYT